MHRRAASDRRHPPLVWCAIAVLALAAVSVSRAYAQTRRVVPDTGRARAAGTDSTPRQARLGGVPASMVSPISPRRAFLSSLVLPGYGQSRLDRGTSGAFFATIDLAAFTMVRRSQADLREARRFRLDTLSAEFTVVGGVATASGTLPSTYSADLVRSRRLQVEDWLAVLAFNHLLGAADAFVSAQLWDGPVSVGVAPTRTGVGAVATLRW